jgi:hypothetical protein
MRGQVHDWSFTTAGQLYYVNHGETELRQRPAPLDVMQAVWAAEREWVTPEFFTCFGGMNDLNVFMLSRTIAQDGSVHCGIFIITNGGNLVHTDDANCVCVHYQTRFPEQVGHWEPVQDRQSRWRWSVDDAVVRDCLWLACQQLKVARSVRDARKKMLVAARNRINSSNETINQGDFAWLTVPDDVVKAVTRRMRSRAALQVAAEHKMLVRVSRVFAIMPNDEEPSTTASQQFVLWCADGRLEGAYPIDQLRLCAPPPERSQYPLVGMVVPVGSEPPGNSKVLKLTRAYRQYLTFLSTRAAITTAAQRVQWQHRAQGSRAPPASEAAMVSRASGEDAALLATGEANRETGSDSSSSPSPSPRRGMVDVTESRSGNEDEQLDHPRYPCAHCGESMDWKDYVFCFFKGCQAPFHKPGVGCSRQEQVVRVNDRLLYCRQTCAEYDRGSVRIASQSSSVSVQPTARSRSLILRPTITRSQREDVHVTARTQPASATASEEPAVAAVAHRPRCKTCLQPLPQWRKGMSCDRCYGYHCKVGRGTEGCSRAGWSKGGSRHVAGILECVECRFSGDADWMAFNEAQAGERNPDRSG